MMPQIDKAIEDAIAGGVPPNQIAPALIKDGWPPALVNEAVEAWLNAHGRTSKRPDFKQWLKKYKTKALPAIVAVSALGFITSFIALLKPWPVKIMVDSAFGTIPAPGPLEPYTHTPELILLTSLLTLLIFIAGSAFGAIKDYLSLQLGFWLNRQVKEETFRHILHLPLYHKQRLAKGDYIYRQNNLTNSLSDLVLDSTTSIVQSVIMVTGILLIMLAFNVRLTLISVVLIPFLFILVRLFGPLLGRISWSLAQISSRTSSSIAESIDNAETVQSYNLEEKQVSRANKLWNEDYRLTARGLLLGRGYRFSNGLLVIASTSAVMYFGGTAALNGEMTLGQLLIFMIYMGYLLGPIEGLANEIATRNQKIVDVSRVYEVIADHEGIETVRKGHHFPIRKGRIEFQNVSYAYDKAPVLENINLVVEGGKKVGIIGTSGSGKSSLLKMVPLFIEPQRGRILIDGIDIQTVDLHELRARVALISQAPQLFSGTVLDNLIDGDIFRHIAQEEIAQAVNAANVSEFLSRLPAGLTSLVGEGGNTLSGGQKQRLAIARALVKNAPIICMDEPTSALDSKSEGYIKQSLPQLTADKTVLLVTHRRPLLDMMDEIYVMEAGQLRKIEGRDGLEHYLAAISGEEATKQAAEEDEKARDEQAEKLLREQQRIATLQAENAKLQQKLSIASNRRPADEGTIYIDH